MSKKLNPELEEAWQILELKPKTKKVSVNLQLPDDLKEQIEEAAGLMDMYISQLYEAALRKTLLELAPHLDRIRKIKARAKA